MSLEITPEALTILSRSLELGGVDPSSGGIRLRSARDLGGGSNVQIELADAPGDTETVIEIEGLRLFVDPGVLETFSDGVVAVEPEHDRIVMRKRDGG